ncbi:MAG: hypothetical protein IKP67_04330, partial [Spirochaetales bacterium]|nr:hypothetical protein [Spirochaetales bacterium]
MKKIISLCLITFCMAACNNTDTTSVWFASGNTVDIENPIIDVNTSSLPEAVRGVVRFTGKASDDVWVKTVDMYYIAASLSETGESVLNDMPLASTAVSGKETQWSLTFDTRQLPDAGTIFRFKLTDEAGKYTYKNITLQLDNYGPDMIISMPVGNSIGNPISNTFMTAVIPVELDSNVITRIDWTLTKSDNEEVCITGMQDLLSAPAASNATYNYVIDPFPITKLDGFEIGWYTLSVCGYSTPAESVAEYGSPSKEWAVSDQLYLDFSSSVPIISMTSPTSIDSLHPTPQSTDAVIGIAVVDDDGVASVDIEWGKLNTDTPLGSGVIALDDAPKSKTIVYTINNLSDGIYWVRARASDIKPNTSAWTERHYFTVDGDLPNIKWISPEQGSWHNGGIVRLSAEVSISGEASIDRLTYRFAPDGSQWHDVPESTAVDPASATHKITVDSQHVSFVGIIPDDSAVYTNGGEGMFSLRVYKNAVDYTESTLLLNFDKIKPTVTIEQPTSDDANLNQTIRISGTAIDFTGLNMQTPGIVDDISIDLSWSGGNEVIPMSDITGVSGWSTSFDTWAAGIGMQHGGEPLTITVTVTDHAGNVAQSVSTVTVDQSTDIPTVSIDNFHNGDKKYGIFTVSGRSDDDDGIRLVQVYLTDDDIHDIPYILDHCPNLITGLTGENAWAACSGTYTWTYKLDLSSMNNGTHRFICRSIDTNGKPSTFGGEYNCVTFTVDPDIPQINLDLDPYINGQTVFEATASKTASGSPDVFIAKAEYKIVGSKAQTGWITFDDADITMSNNNQTAALRLNYTAEMIDRFGQGDVTISIRATDSSDKQNEASDIVFVDNVKLNAVLQTPDSLIVRTAKLRLQGGISDEEPSSGIYNDDCSIKYSFDGSQYEQALSGVQIGSLSNYDVQWNIPATLKDGVISLKLFAADKAGNGVQNESGAVISDVRLCRYPPKFDLITVNGISASDYMSVKKEIAINMTVSDNDVNDTAARGISRIGAYLLTSAQYAGYSQDKSDLSGYVVIGEDSYSPPAESKNWTKSWTFTSDYDYILFRVTDVTGGWRDAIYRITIDSQPPIADFTYSSVGYYDGASHKYVNRTTYSDTLWIKLGAKDKVKSSDEYKPLTGTYIYLGVGTAADNNDILGEKIYLAGS